MKTEVGIYNGHRYILEHDRMCNQGGYESVAFRWFLRVDGQYQGDFARKRDAMAYLDKLANSTAP